MAKARNDFTDILIKKRVLSPDQLEEALSLANSTGIKLQDALAKLNYASLLESTQAMAEKGGYSFVDLTTVEIPKTVIELVPESVARENIVLPLALEGN
ncbi:MAG: GspE/PulE family protein, partial [Gemmataceae bacterium]